MDLTALTNDELSQLIQDANAEQRKRADVASIPLTMEGLNQAFLAAQGTLPGAEWRQPAGAHDSYPLDWQVQHNSTTWTSLVAFNVWEPGVSSWSEVVPPTDPTAPPATWVQPLGSTDDYNIGDQVTFEGQVWESTINANVWSPTAYPAGWKLITT